MNLTALKPKYSSIWLVIPFLWLLSRCPMPMIYILGTALGNFLYRIASSRRRIALRNLELCFPERSTIEIRTLAKETFRNITRAVLSSGIGWWASPDKLAQLVRLNNSRHYDNALNSGRNVIVLAPHFVGLDIGGIYLSMTSPIVGVYQHSRNPIFDQKKYL